MDVSDTWLEHLLRDLLPPSLTHHLLHPHSPFQLLKRRALTTITKTLNILYPILLPPLNRAISYLHSSPDIVFFLALLTSLYVALLVLGFMRRVMLFWTRLLFTALFWGAVALLGAVVWQRGVERTVGDLVAGGRGLLGWGVVVREVWGREYERYREEERLRARVVRGGYY